MDRELSRSKSGRAARGQDDLPRLLVLPDGRCGERRLSRHSRRSLILDRERQTEAILRSSVVAEAQLVEPLVVVQVVGGSSPISHLTAESRACGA